MSDHLIPMGPRAVVRSGFSQCDVWREAVGQETPLLMFATEGSLDAPQQIHAGSAIRLNIGTNRSGRNFVARSTIDRDYH